MIGKALLHNPVMLCNCFNWGLCVPGGLLTNPSIQLPFRAPATLNLPTTVRECRCLVLNFHLDSSVSRQKSLWRFNLGTRPWECLLKASHRKTPFPFLTQAVSPALPSCVLSRLALRTFPSWGGHCAVSYSKDLILLAFLRLSWARSTVTKGALLLLVQSKKQN